jgi:hypothetical protein
VDDQAARFRFAGYFPKKVVPRPDWLEVPSVVEICSVSECMSPGPSDWIDQWKHNTETWLFDTVEAAASVLPAGERDAFTIFGYRFWDGEANEGDVRPLPSFASPPGPEPEFESLGFDAVGHWGTGFNCSPLSCNHGASKLETNEHCLFKTAEAAIAGAKLFSSGGWEPGPYWVVEVLRRRVPG